MNNRLQDITPKNKVDLLSSKRMTWSCLGRKHGETLVDIKCKSDDKKILKNNYFSFIIYNALLKYFESDKGLI